MLQALDIFHTFTWAHAIMISMAAWLILMILRIAPEVRSVKYLISTLNDKGGHILILVVLTVMFFRAAMELLYFSLANIVDGKIDSQNALLVQGFQFVTGTAFGASIGALLTSMNASNERAGGKDRGETVSTVTAVSTTRTPGADAPKPSSAGDATPSLAPTPEPTPSPLPAPVASPVEVSGQITGVIVPDPLGGK